MTNPTQQAPEMAEEPLSVRIARIRGCQPIYHPPITDKRYSPERPHAFEWRCECPGGEELRHAPDWFRAVLSNAGYEAWLQPAAAFALLAEMVEATIDEDFDVRLFRGESGYFVDGVTDLEGGFSPTTLEEAIALAWLAWKQEPSS